MTWLKLDDGMLEHPKWIRALRIGGGEALHLWLRLMAWSSRNLTDGVIPADVLDAIQGPKGQKTLATAWRALAEATLIARQSNGDVTLHGYLDYQPSRAKTLAERDRRAQSERNRRVPAIVPGHGLAATPDRALVPSRPVPSPITLSLAREAPRPEIDAREIARDDTRTEPATIAFLPEAWEPPEPFVGEAVTAGVTRQNLAEAVKYWRGRKLGGEWLSPEAFFRGKFAAIRQRAETERYHEQQRQRAASGSGPRASPFPGADVDTTGAACAFRPSSEHVAYAVKHDLGGLDVAVSAYRKGATMAGLDTMSRERDFMARLRCWRATGTFIAEGPLPRPVRRAEVA